jgi:hypothetical protein
MCNDRFISSVFFRWGKEACVGVSWVPSLFLLALVIIERTYVLIGGLLMRCCSEETLSSSAASSVLACRAVRASLSVSRQNDQTHSNHLTIGVDYILYINNDWWRGFTTGIPGYTVSRGLCCVHSIKHTAKITFYREPQVWLTAY